MKTKILIIEHNSRDIELTELELKKGDINFVAEIVQTKKQYTTALDNFKPDIILSNYTSPSFDGLTALKIREEYAPQTPFIFISESIGEENAVELLKCGATDFVLKERLGTLAFKISRALDEVATSKSKTEQNQTENKKVKKLFQREAKYRNFFENSRDGMLLTITDGQILAANPAACKIFQMTEKEIIDAGRMGIVDITDPRLKILLEERQRSGSAKGELTLVRKDGSTFPGELTSTMFKGFNGEQRTSMIIRDISQWQETDQKLSFAANELQKTLKDLNNLLDSSLDIICTIDKEGKFVSVSAASKRIWGYNPTELIGKNYIDYVFSQDITKTLETDISIQNGVPVTMFENQYMHKDGHIVPMLWSSRWDEKDQMSYGIAKDATEKKKLEKAYEIEKKRFMDLYFHAPSCMGILKGPNHVFEMANPLYLQLIEKEDIIGKTVKEVLPELEAQGIFEFLNSVYTTGATFSANEMLVKFDFHGNGKLVDTYLNFIYQAHRDHNGEIDGILFFAIDVTEQVLSRKKIEESEKRYAELIQNLPVATYSCDSEGRIMIYNKAAVALWGRKPEIGIDKWCGFWKVYSVDGNIIPLEVRPMATAFRDGKAIIGEEVIIERPNGEKRNVIPHPVPYFDNEGRITGSVNVLTDITEIKKAQQTLRESEKKYRHLFDNNPMPMWITDLNSFKFLDVNKMTIEQYGYSRDEFLTMTAVDINPETDKESFIQFYKSFEYEPGNFNKGIWNHQKKNGAVFQAEIIAHEIIYEGVPARLILANDITDRRKAELNLECRNKELIKTNQELDRFVYSVSHDLRSPLTSILGLVSLIETESLETDTLEHAEMIRNSINRLDNFIKNILSYSRNNRTGLEVEKISIQETTLDILDSLQSMREADGIYYEIDIKEQKPFYTDRLRFNTILENLISNAIKHHKKEETGRYIKILGSSDHEKLRITIADNGIGILPEYHQKIFEMFFRLSGKKDGSGIGLYIVKDTIEMLQGSIEIQSDKGIGTTFIVTLKNLNS